MALHKKIIAVCGKGGVGKTAFIALLTKSLSELNPEKRMIVVDADPAVGLPTALGIQVDRTIGQVRDIIIGTATEELDGACADLVNNLDYLLMETLIETDKYSFLAMGRTNSKGCYCSINDLLHSALNSLIDNFDIILIDGEAGLEQINRQVANELDYLLILSDSSSRGRETVAHIKQLVEVEKVIKCNNLGVVLNNIPESVNWDDLQAIIQGIGLDVIGIIPRDENITSFDLTGRSLMDLPAYSKSIESVMAIAQKIVS